MKKFTKIALLLLISLPIVGGIIVSCAEEPDCSLTSRASLRGVFYTLSDDNKPVVGSIPTLTITALGTDSILLNKGTSVKDAYLYLQYTADTTAIVLHFDEAWKDTIVFGHTNTPYFVSLECGYEMQQVVTKCSYTRHFIDSIYIKDHNANKDGKESLQLFYSE